MVMPNPERIRRGLDHFRDGLRPACEQTWGGFYGDDWLNQVNQRLHNPEQNPSTDDVAFLLKGMKATWNEIWQHQFAPAVRNLVFEVADVRNKWAHQAPLSTDDASRALDSMERLLDALGDVDEQHKVRDLRRDLLRQMFEEEGRSERRKAAAKPTEGQPQAGLAPWRDVITPHTDVASGRFDQAEFAADLFEVATGSADGEYGDPEQFFARTYMTSGLRELLVGAARRLSGGRGDPVIELQTNFGGGKTHSMIALYHLASGIPANHLSGVAEAFAEEGVSLPTEVSRAVLVGQKISPASPETVEPGVTLHTLWGRLAYQLGGTEGYELVRIDDENGTNPGAALKTLFEKFGPAVVLIDEWVAYARQLRDGGDRLAGGDFDTQFTFAQALTEAASAAKNTVVLISIPASDIEVGGDRGRAALEKLKNVVTRQAKQWQPASPDESFEIVRRRLFDPISTEQARVRDGVIRAFVEMYRLQPAQFPSDATEAEYRRRMELSYPIHPELFDRLFNDWSSLDKFQRTRGVLRLMALAVSQLWQRGDQSLLIMPGTLPMDSGALVSEMKKYLEEGWDPVIKSDVDGENALPLKIDNENKHFGQLSATRRAARAVYMASAARPDGARGVDIKSVVLGCVQPGEPPAQFADALNRLSGQATHLYVDGAQYWYSLKANVTRVAADRAASNFTDHDADDEVKARIGRQQRTPFTAMQVFAEGPGDVPDDDDGVRLVVLSPEVTHQANDDNSAATELAGRILAQRDGGPRLNRNMLVFVAAGVNRLSELRAAARLHLSWKSIVADYEALDLTAHQKRQAESKVAETSSQVDSLIAETFTLVLTPHQEPGTAEVVWNTTRATAAGPLAERVAKKLATEEKLIQAYGGVRVKMDIDRYSLWSDRHDIGVQDLWTTYARYPHLPRLVSAQTLNDAISDGTSNMSWSQETFAYAEAHDGSAWVGIRAGQHVDPTPSGLLVDPDHVKIAEPALAPDDTGGSSSTPTATTGAATPTATGAGPGGKQAKPEALTGFYALFELDPVRAIRQLGDILEYVTNRLGENVELSLEVRANQPEGFDDATRRVVSENANNLNAKAAEFE
jgi:predicted AAA+ superfamily ATPase